MKIMVNPTIALIFFLILITLSYPCVLDSSLIYIFLLAVQDERDLFTLVEAAGTAPASRKGIDKVSTCVFQCFILKKTSSTGHRLPSATFLLIPLKDKGKP